MSRRKRIKQDISYVTKNGRWLIIQRIFGIAATFCLSIVFANFLPKSTYGIYKNILAWGAILMIPTLAGISQATTRSVAKGFYGVVKNAFQIKLRWGILTFLFASGIGAYYIFQGNSTIGLSYIILGILYPLNEGTKLFQSVLNGQKKFKTLAYYATTIRVLSVAVLIGTVFFTKNVTIIVLANILPLTLLNTLAYIQVKKKHVDNDKVDGETISYGKHLSVMNILTTVAQRIDNIVLFQYGAVDVAIYNIATAPVENINWVKKGIKTLSFPSFSKKTKKEIKHNTKRRLVLILGVITAIIILYILSAPFIFEIFFRQYMESVFYSQIYAVSLIGTATTAYFVTILEAKMAKKALYAFHTSTALISIALILVLVPLYGILGAVCAKMSIRFIRMIASGFLVKKL